MRRFVVLVLVVAVLGSHLDGLEDPFFARSQGMGVELAIESLRSGDFRLGDRRYDWRDGTRSVLAVRSRVDLDGRLEPLGGIDFWWDDREAAITGGDLTTATPWVFIWSAPSPSTCCRRRIDGASPSRWCPPCMAASAPACGAAAAPPLTARTSMIPRSLTALLRCRGKRRFCVSAWDGGGERVAGSGLPRAWRRQGENEAMPSRRWTGAEPPYGVRPHAGHPRSRPSRSFGPHPR